MADETLLTLKAKRAATLGRMRLLAVAQAWWPVFVIVLLFCAVALAGGFDRLGKVPAALFTPLILVALAIMASRCSKAFRPPSEADADSALDAQSELRPVSAYTDRPASHAANTQDLWRAHRARLAHEIENLRLPCFSAAWRALDPYWLRAVLPAAVLLFAALAGTDGPGRLWRALFPDYGALVGADRMIVEAWVTPPDYTGRAPIFLKPGVVGVKVPKGSEVTLRTHAASAPRLVIRGDNGIRRLRFAATPDGAFEAKADVTADSTFSVRWWGERARFGFSVLPDSAPEVEFVSLPIPDGQDRIAFTWSARDDYGLAGLSLGLRLREPHPAAPDSEDFVPVPLPAAEGLKEASETVQIDLTRHRWAGLAVDLRLVARDGAGQEGTSDTVPFVLPEKLFLDPVARAAQEARVTVLRDPRPYRELQFNPFALTPDAINTPATARLDLAPPGVQEAAMMLDAITYRGELFFNDLGVYFGLRTAHRMLEAAASKNEADAVDPLLWAIALKLEHGSVADAAQRLEAARRALERALRDGASEAEIRRLMEAFRDAANEYLAAKMAEAIARGLDAPPSDEDGAQRAGGPGLGGQDFEDMLNALQDLTETGATEQARQLLSDITNLLENLEFQRGETGQGAGMPGLPGEQGDRAEDLPPEEQAMTDAMRRLSEILREQRQLNDDTLAQQRGEAPEAAPPPGSPEGEAADRGSGGRQDGEGSGRGQRPGDQGAGSRSGEGDTGEAGGGRRDGRSLAQRQAELGELVERFAREQGARPGAVPGEGEEAIGRILEAQRRAERALEAGDEGRAIASQERATELLSELSRELAASLDAARAARLGEDGRAGGNDPFGRVTGGFGADGSGVEVPDAAERQRAKDILDELRRRYDQTDEEEEKEYLERLLDRF